MGDSFGIHLLDTPVSVRSDSPALLARLRACYGGSVALGSEAAVHGTVALRDDGYRVEVAGRPAAAAPDLAGAVRALNHELMHAVMLRNPHLFFVHGGVVARGGRAVVLPGLSRAGKSTLVLAMLRLGAELLSDELLVFDPRTRALLPFPRAVKVRDECLDYFPEHAGAFVGEGEGRFLPPTLAKVAASARARVLVAPRWDASGDDALRPITAGEGLLHLARSALNFGSQRERSVDHLAALASDCRCCALTWRDPHAAAAAMLAELETTPR